MPHADSVGRHVSGRRPPRENFRFATRLADDISILGRGQCVWSGAAEALAADTGVHERWLGV